MFLVVFLYIAFIAFIVFRKLQSTKCHARQVGTLSGT